MSFLEKGRTGSSFSEPLFLGLLSQVSVRLMGALPGGQVFSGQANVSPSPFTELSVHISSSTFWSGDRTTEASSPLQNCHFNVITTRDSQPGQQRERETNTDNRPKRKTPEESFCLSICYVISSLIRNFLNIIVRGFIEHPLISCLFSPEVLLYMLRLILALG